MRSAKVLNQKRKRRARRSRYGVKGTVSRPRLSVFRSNAYTSVQLVDDEGGITLVNASTRGLKSEGEGSAKVRGARMLGELVASRAKEKGITAIIFDRGRYKYHGRVKAVAEGLRKGGIIF